MKNYNFSLIFLHQFQTVNYLIATEGCYAFNQLLSFLNKVILEEQLDQRLFYLYTLNIIIKIISIYLF